MSKAQHRHLKYLGQMTIQLMVCLWIGETFNQRENTSKQKVKHSNKNSHARKATLVSKASLKLLHHKFKLPSPTTIEIKKYLIQMIRPMRNTEQISTGWHTPMQPREEYWNTSLYEEYLNTSKSKRPSNAPVWPIYMIGVNKKWWQLYTYSPNSWHKLYKCIR